MTKSILIRHQFAVSTLDERIDKYLITFSIVFLEVSNNAALSIYSVNLDPFELILLVYLFGIIKIPMEFKS